MAERKALGFRIRCQPSRQPGRATSATSLAPAEAAGRVEGVAKVVRQDEVIHAPVVPIPGDLDVVRLTGRHEVRAAIPRQSTDANRHEAPREVAEHGGWRDVEARLDHRTERLHGAPALSLQV